MKGVFFFIFCLICLVQMFMKIKHKIICIIKSPKIQTSQRVTDPKNMVDE